MNLNRRDFVRRLAIGLVAALRRAEARPSSTLGPAKTGEVAALKRVKAITRHLTVQPGRWLVIVGHHSGIAVGNADIYDRAHRARGMENGLAYHFVIGNGSRSGDGEIEIGSRWIKQLKGGHVRNDHINQIGIGICCVGNFEVSHPSPAQMESFRALVAYLRNDVVKSDCRFLVHREVDGSHTLCPGRNFPVQDLHRRFG